MTGVPPSGSGHSGQAPEPQEGLGHTASVPNAFVCEDEESGYHDLCPCVTAHARDIMQVWTGTNCTWVDDDITALGILAGHAIRAGLHHHARIPKTLIAAIDGHTASAIEARRAIDAEGGVVADESAVAESETPTPSSARGEQGQ